MSLDQTRAQLQELLRQIFQFDAAAELDHGIYRVIRQRQDDIKEFIEQSLPSTVERLLAERRDELQGDMRATLESLRQRVIDALGPEALDAAGELESTYHQTRIGKDYLEARRRVAAINAGEQREIALYDDLITFFSRYYEDGDFCYQRRLSNRPFYALPRYGGEDVLLHWANRGQHYIKTSDRFSHYRFEAPEAGARVEFVVRDADTAQNNVKGGRRFYMLRAAQPTTWDAKAHALTVNFVYRPLTAEEEQRYGKRDTRTALVDAMIETLAEQLIDATLRAALLAETDTRAAPLRRHLTRYTRGSSSDFFIHPNLKQFLNDELDFYILNEVARVRELAALDDQRAEAYVTRIRALKAIGQTIINFLAQIEEFQHRVFERRKFVLRMDYLATLDRVPEPLRAAVFANSRQREAWQRLFGWRGTQADAPMSLVVDTRLFDDDFKAALLASFDDLDTELDGLLIRSENYQALNLLQARYAKQVKCIYIDPPYNTGNDGFLYKDDFQRHSTWLTMMDERLRLAKELLSDDGVIFVSIDDNEIHHLRTLMEQVFDDENFIVELTWEKGRKNDAKLFSVGHEYMLVYAKSLQTLRNSGVVWRESRPGAKEIIEALQDFYAQHGDDLKAVENALQEWYKSLPNSHPSKKLTRYRHIDKFSRRNGPWRDRDISWPGGGGPRYDVIHPATKKPCKVPERGWGFATSEKMDEQIAKELVVFRATNDDPPFRKAHLIPVPDELDEDDFLDVDDETDDSIDDDAVGLQVMGSVIYAQSQSAVKFLRNMMGGKVFNNPKDHTIIARLIKYCTESQDIILDFFAGSGTTAHAVIDMNRADGGERKFVLIEMGEYFDTVLLPRVQKAIYTDAWRDGQPQADKPLHGASALVAVCDLEQYEDALNNIHFSERSQQHAEQLRMFEDYVAEHMLVAETRQIDAERLGRDPFGYALRAGNGNGGAIVTVDAVTTFAFVTGMRTRRQTREIQHGRPYLIVTGDIRDTPAIAIWRSTDRLDLTADRATLRDLIARHAVHATAVYINGDCLLPAEGRALYRTEHEIARLMGAQPPEEAA
jgi:adenine-specific DNA-methyltransferase